MTPVLLYMYEAASSFINTSASYVTSEYSAVIYSYEFETFHRWRARLRLQKLFTTLWSRQAI